jgi:arylsulfatase A-like enzyme
VSNIDIPPTILHFYGLQPEESFRGHSLLSIESYPEKGCFAEGLYHEAGKGEDINRDVYSYRERDLKIIFRADRDEWEMFDLEKDPEERENVFTASPDAGRLKEILLPRVRRWQKNQ